MAKITFRIYGTESLEFNGADLRNGNTIRRHAKKMAATVMAAPRAIDPYECKIEAKSGSEVVLDETLASLLEIDEDKILFDAITASGDADNVRQHMEWKYQRDFTDFHFENWLDVSEVADFVASGVSESEEGEMDAHLAVDIYLGQTTLPQWLVNRLAAEVDEILN